MRFSRLSICLIVSVYCALFNSCHLTSDGSKKNTSLQSNDRKNILEANINPSFNLGIKCKPLLASRFKNLDHFKTMVSIEYNKDYVLSDSLKNNSSSVTIRYASNGENITRNFTSGVTQGDLIKLLKSKNAEKLQFVFTNTNEVRSRKALEKINILSRWKADIFGSKDIAFFNLAETSVRHINTPSIAHQSIRDSLEKGYLNTFNHITAQAIITTFFSEEIADLIGDLHERYNMPELTTGKFSQKQLIDTLNNPTDNYVDIINNEIGQYIGKALKIKYGINKNTVCTPVLLADYLNTIQSYYMWTLEIGMDNYRPTDMVVRKFSKKLNAILEGS